jgi:hypothetical protein
LRRALKSKHNDVRLLKVENWLVAHMAEREVIKRLLISAAKKDGNELCCDWCFGNRA